jgi:hypothetical protein
MAGLQGMPSKLFLLSPASLNGLRAKQLMALYFRGKIAYARRFALPSPVIGGDGIFVITTGYGLVPPDWRITEERMKRMRKIDIDVTSRSYTKPLREHAELVARALEPEPDAQIVLLGSVATGKYVDVLQPIFREKLRFPAHFAGLGDMARGGLMLRAAREGKELEYISLEGNRKRPPGATGKMPALD